MNAMVEVGVQVTTRPATIPKKRRRQQPRYHVILLDDDEHTYVYVIDMLRKLFGYTPERSYDLASQVDQDGRVIMDTTTLERAELKRDQVHAFGRDWRIDNCQGSMSCILEPVAV